MAINNTKEDENDNIENENFNKEDKNVKLYNEKLNDLSCSQKNKIITFEKLIKNYINEEVKNGNRKDRSDLNIITIDNADTKIRDDALHIIKISPFVWEVGVHIAEISEFLILKENLESYKHQILNDHLKMYLCNLIEGKERPVFSVVFSITNKGVISNYKIEKSLIIIKKSFTYENANCILSSKNMLNFKFGDTLIKFRRIINIIDPYNSKRSLKSQYIIQKFMELANVYVRHHLSLYSKIKIKDDSTFTAPLRKNKDISIQKLLADVL